MTSYHCRGAEGLASLDPVEFDDPALSARQAGVKIWFDIPIFSGFGQFRLNILTLEEERLCTSLYQEFDVADQLM
jgi:hypothetical protein